MSSIDNICQRLKDNRFKYDEKAQELDVKLFCHYLKLKYSNIELRDVCDKLFKHIEKCNEKKDAWFTND